MSLSHQIHGQLSGTISNEDDSDYIGVEELENLNKAGTQVKSRTVYILNPVIPLCWYSLCRSWRIMLDFDFNVQQPQLVTDVCDRFNKTEYVKKHLIYDNHHFVQIPDNIRIYKGDIIEVSPSRLIPSEIYYVHDIVWFLPDILVNSSSHTSRRIDHAEFAPHATLVMKLIKPLPSSAIHLCNTNVENDINITTDSNINYNDSNDDIDITTESNINYSNNNSLNDSDNKLTYYIHETKLIKATALYYSILTKLTHFPIEQIKFTLVTSDSRQQLNQERHQQHQYFVELPKKDQLKGVQYVHPNVDANKPHIFGRVYCDSVHTSNMLYRGNALLGCYFNVLNVKKETRKQNLMRFTVLASDNDIEYEKVFRAVSEKFIEIEKNGIWGFYDGIWSKTSFTWAMTIADMKGRHPLQCRRAANKDARAESKCHLGVFDGIRFPSCQTLLEDGIITPTKFLNTLHDYLFNILKLSKAQGYRQGMQWAVTTSQELAIPSMQYNAALKCINEPGHVILLGVFKRLFELIWSKMKKKFSQVQLSKCMQGLLSKLNDQIKFDCNAADRISVLGYYGDMNQSWKNWIQQVISLPSITNWDCDIHLLWHFGRWAAQLFCCQTEIERQRLEKGLKTLLNQS